MADASPHVQGTIQRQAVVSGGRSVVQRNGGDEKKNYGKLAGYGGAGLYSYLVGSIANEGLKGHGMGGMYQRGMMGWLMNPKTMMKGPWQLKLASLISTLGMMGVYKATGGMDVMKGMGKSAFDKFKEKD